jgi:hypothetical protein
LLLKHKTPGGSKLVLDEHPHVTEKTAGGCEAAEDLWVTEGAKKGLNPHGNQPVSTAMA